MKNKKGFTLVELLAVIVILGVLLMIAVPAVQNVIKKTKNNATQKQAELFIDAAKKMAIIDEPTNDKVIYKLSDLDSSVDTNRFTGMVVALKENESYKYYIYLNDSVNKKTIGNNDNDILGNNDNNIFKFASEDNINENVTDGGKDFKKDSTQIIQVKDKKYSYSSSNNTLNTYYSVKENVTVTVDKNTNYKGVVIKSRDTIRVLLTQQKTIMSYTSIQSNKSIVGTTIPTLEDIKILSGNSNISNNFCDGKYTAQADCSSGFKSGYNAGVAIWLSCGNSDSCPCKENGDITSGTTYCPRLAVNGSIHTRGLASSGIYFMPVIEADPSQVKSSS